MKNEKINVYDITLIGLMVAVIEVFKFALMEIPNIELTSFWLIMFSRHFGKKVFFVVPIFVAIEGIIFGFGIWWIMYLYAWPLLIFITRFFKKSDSALTWAIISGVFGLCFGTLDSIAYLFIGGFPAAFAHWVSGIPWDITHGIGNFVLMLLLYKPVSKAMLKVQKTARKN